MKYLRLTNTILRAEVDDEDYKQCKLYKWSILPDGYVYTCIERKTVKLHSFIANTLVRVDHKDQNKLNCQRNNLREANRSQNGANRKKLKHGVTSQYKGVSIEPRTGKFAARITINQKTKHLGNFETERQAAHAYDRKAKELFGEFAYLNFPLIIQSEVTQ